MAGQSNARSWAGPAPRLKGYGWAPAQRPRPRWRLPTSMASTINTKASVLNSRCENKGLELRVPDHEMTEAQYGGMAGLAQHSCLLRGRAGGDPAARVAGVEGRSGRPGRWAGPAGSSGAFASFHFLDGEGVMVVGTEEVAVAAGATVVVPTGVARGVRATSRMVFLGSLGDPASENGPH